VTMAPTLYALCGLPFAGKSTIARELAEKVGAPIVRLDAINGERGLGLDCQAIPQHEWERTYTEAYRRLEQALVANSSVIFDHVNFTRAERDRVRHIAARYGANVQIVYVSVTIAEARRRLIANRATKGRNDVRDDDFDLVVRHFEPPDDEPDVVRRALH
jgi:predicted kinase